MYNFLYNISKLLVERVLKCYRRNRQFSYDFQVCDTQRDVWHEHFAVHCMDQSSNRVACLAVPKRFSRHSIVIRSPISWQIVTHDKRRTFIRSQCKGCQTVAVGFGSVEIRGCGISGNRPSGSSTSFARDKSRSSRLSMLDRTRDTVLR